MFFTSKKAMSPLIATVLLIAFAVALGAMIMNWSADVVETDSTDVSEYCSGVSVFSDVPACYDDGKLSLKIKNDGSSRVDAIKLSFSSEIGDSSLILKDTSLIVGESLERSIPFLYTGGTIKLEFFPLVSNSEELVECVSGFEQSALPTC